MDLQIIDFEYLNAISTDNIFNWKNGVSFEYTQNTSLKKVRIQDNSFQTLAKFSYSVEDNYEEIIKLLPRSSSILGTIISSKNMIETIVQYPHLSVYADGDILDIVLKSLVDRWGIKKVLNSLEKLSAEHYYNYTEKVFCSKAMLYLYREKSFKLYSSHLQGVYGKDLTSILMIYVDFEN